jgi:hypothetical protein
MQHFTVFLDITESNLGPDTGYCHSDILVFSCHSKLWTANDLLLPQQQFLLTSISRKNKDLDSSEMLRSANW